MGRVDRRWLFGGALLVLLLGVLFFLAAPSGTTTLDVPDEAYRGQSFDYSGTFSGLDWTGDGYVINNFSVWNTYSSPPWCGDSVGSPYACLQSSHDAGVSEYQVYKCNDGGKCNFVHTLERIAFDTTSQADTGVVDFARSDVSEPSSDSQLYGFKITNAGIVVNVDWRCATDDACYPAVCFCVDASDYSNFVFGAYDTSCFYTSYETSTFTWGKYGRSYKCKCFTGGCAPTTTRTSGFYVDYTSSGSGWMYISFGPRCFHNSSYCTGTTLLWEGLRIEPRQPAYSASEYVEDDSYGEIYCPVSYGVTPSTDTSGSYSGQCIVPDTAILGDHTMKVYLYDRQAVDYWCRSRDMATYDTDTDTVTVLAQATDVWLTDYGSSSGSPEQEPDDTYVEFRVNVDSTAFDSVKVYIDGTLKETYTPSDFSATTPAYVDDRISMSGYSDGSHTIKAELYVSGSLVDSDTKTFYYYSPGADVTSVSQVSGSNQVSVSGQTKGGWENYKAYIDSESCTIASGDDGPWSTDAHDWLSFSKTWEITCTLTQGTHDLYFCVSPESSPSSYVCDSSSFYYTPPPCSGSVDITDPASDVDDHVQTDVRDQPPSTYSRTVTVSYSTDCSSATIKLFVNGVEKQSWSVTGSGTRSYTLSSADVTCGPNLVEAKIYDPSQNLLSSDSVYVNLHCWYLTIATSGTVEVPSADGTTVKDGATVDVLFQDSVSPSEAYSLYFTWNGTDLSSKVSSSCPPGYDHCAEVVHPDDVSMSCGQTVSLHAELRDAGSVTRASSDSTITLQCVTQYVFIETPADGSIYDIENSSSVPPDYNIMVGVDYAYGGTPTFKHYLNGSEITPPEVTPCPYAKCWNYTGFASGENNITVEMWDGGTLLDSDTVRVYVYPWQFATFVSAPADSATGLLYVREYASHAQSCSVSFDGGSPSSMLYNSAQSQWEFQLDKDTHSGKSYEVNCYSPSGSVVYTSSGTVTWGTVPGGGEGGGGGGAYRPPEREITLPFWPDTTTSEGYVWTILDKSPFLVGRFKAVSVSRDSICVSSTSSVSAVYYKYSLSSIPSDQSSLSETLADIRLSSVSSLPVSSPQSGVYCVENRGSGMYVFTSGTYKVRVLVAGGGFVGGGLPLLAVGIIVLVVLAVVMGWL